MQQKQNYSSMLILVSIGGRSYFDLSFDFFQIPYMDYFDHSLIQVRICMGYIHWTLDKMAAKILSAKAAHSFA